MLDLVSQAAGLPGPAKRETAHRLELGGGNLRDGVKRVSRCRRRRNRVDGRGVEAIRCAVITLGRRTFVLPSHAEIQRETVLHAPIILHKNGGIPGLLRAVCVQVEAAAGRQPQQERSEILAKRRRGGVILRTPGPIRAESVNPRRVTVRVSALAVIPRVGADLDGMVAVDLHHVAEELVNIEGSVAVAAHSQTLEAGGGGAGAGAECHVRQAHKLRTAGDVGRKADVGGVEAVRRRAVVLDEARPVGAHIHHHVGRDGIDIVQRRPPVGPIQKLAEARIPEVIVLIPTARLSPATSFRPTA